MVDKNDIIGTWTLVDRGTDDPVDAELSKARYGEKSNGLLILLNCFYSGKLLLLTIIYDAEKPSK